MITELTVTYVSGEPTSITYYHISYGLIKFDVDDDRAVLDPKWNRLSSQKLKETHKDQRPTTGDVLREVQALPFITSIDAANLYKDI